MQTLTIRNTVFGDGIPKICIPIVGKNKKEIFQNSAEISDRKSTRLNSSHP